MSTFGSLSTAMSGLHAARTGLEVTGQNVANVGTGGYTRQQVNTSPVPAVGATGLTAGQGVHLEQIARLGNDFLDARVHSTAGASGLAKVRAETLTSLEDMRAEPGEGALSGRLDAFWSAWGDLANHPGDGAPAAALLTEAEVLTGQIASGYRQVANEWANVRQELSGGIDQVNHLATQVADLNERIQQATNTGTSPNELIDQRSVLVEELSTLTGAQVHHGTDGTIDVHIAGNALIQGTTARELTLSGPTRMPTSTEQQPVTISWAHNDTPANLAAGELAGAADILAPWGEVAEAAEHYNTLATELAEQVNTIYAGAADAEGQTGHQFFTLDEPLPAALGIGQAIDDPAEVLTGAPGQGELDATIATAIADLADDGPSQTWADAVTSMATVTSTAIDQASLAQAGATGAKDAQLSQAAVSMDEESVNLLTYQRAYQASARALTAVDDMLETLINRTGRVGL